MIGTTAGARMRQAAVISRNEGVKALANRVGLYLRRSVVDAGDICWMDRDLTVARRVDTQGLIAKAAVTDAEHEMLDAVRRILPDVRSVRERAGGQRWYVYQGDDPTDFFYTGWTFRDRMVVQERPLIELPLPSGYAQFEDAWVPPERRNSGAVGDAVEAIGRCLAEDGVHHLISKMDHDNGQVVRAAEKHGWRHVARVRGTMYFHRWTQWEVDLIEPVVPQLSRLEGRRR